MGVRKEELLVKKFMMIVLGVLLVCLFLAHLGPMIALIITLAICYYALKKFQKTESKTLKAILGIVIGVAGLISLANLPALLGLVALMGLYYIHKHWPQKEEQVQSDPFTNFEREWEKLQNN